MKTRLLFLLLFSVLGAGSLFSQTVRPQEFLNDLAVSSNGARVQVNMNSELSTLLNRPKSLDGRTVEGYRVYLFNDNGQFAGDEARRILARFRASFPDIPSELTYQVPYWKVAVGYCLTKDELMSVFGRVKSQFPSAFTASKEELPLKNFLRTSSVADSTLVE